MRAATLIKATRWDCGKSRPITGETVEMHATFLNEWRAMRLEGLYGWPLWEREVHDLVHEPFRELSSIFKAYSVGMATSVEAAEARTIDLAELHDFVVDVGLETDNGAPPHRNHHTCHPTIPSHTPPPHLPIRRAVHL